ncbi:MAG: AzlD domain-containing protein [Actinomycetota bacterium]|jgi:branched chain amino acid efflux pump|nr:AzlD domain-containing protein [Actinomycetota bacterium]
MRAAWVVVALVGFATVAIKALGPVLLGGRPLPARSAGVVALLAPALLAALVAINTVGSGQRLIIDARLLGVAAAAIALWLRAPVLIVVVLAAVVTGVARAATGW